MRLIHFILALSASTSYAQHYNDARPSDRHERPHRENIQLLCHGQADKITTETRTGNTWNNETKKFEPTAEIINGRRDFEATINISILGDRGRIRIPKHLIPAVNGGGSDGWWQIEDMMVGHNEIRGRFQMNGLNRPNIVIDRRNGTMSLDGMLKFNGRCEQNSGRRHF